MASVPTGCIRLHALTHKQNRKCVVLVRKRRWLTGSSFAPLSAAELQSVQQSVITACHTLWNQRLSCLSVTLAFTLLPKPTGAGHRASENRCERLLYSAVFAAVIALCSSSVPFFIPREPLPHRPSPRRRSLQPSPTSLRTGHPLSPPLLPLPYSHTCINALMSMRGHKRGPNMGRHIYAHGKCCLLLRKDFIRKWNLHGADWKCSLSATCSHLPRRRDLRPHPESTAM